MSTKKISQLQQATEITANDLVQVVDVEDPAMASSGTNKRITGQQLANGVAGLISSNTLSGTKITDNTVTSAKLAPITATGSTSPRSLPDRFADTVNVKDFGAVGDGVADDTAAFDLAVADGRVVLITDGSYYLTKTYSGLSNFMIFGKVTWTNANFRVIPTFNMYGNMQSKVQSSMTTDRQELQIYASSNAFGTNSRGAGIHLYGNGDKEHAGNVAFLTGQNDQGDARMIISGGSSDSTSEGYRTNTDTRVTIGNSIFDFVDNELDTGLLTLRNPINRPAIYITDASQAEGEMAVPNGERLDMGHWDGTETFTPRLSFNSSGNIQPGADNTQSMGTSDFRWSVVYAGTGSINTSDANQKQDIADLDETEKEVAIAIKGLIKKFRFRDAVLAKGSDARIHVGVIAQDVKAAFEAKGLDASRYGMFCLDTHEDGTTTMGIRHDELLAFMIAALTN
jgi:hypothetical protein